MDDLPSGRLAPTWQWYGHAQEELEQLSKRQRRQHQEIFDVEDQVEERWDALINA